MESWITWQVLSRIFRRYCRLYESERGNFSGSATQGLSTLCSYKFTFKRCQFKSPFACAATDKGGWHQLGRIARQWLGHFPAQWHKLRATRVCTEKYSRLSDWWRSTSTHNCPSGSRQTGQHSKNIFRCGFEILAPSTSFPRCTLVP